MMGELLFEPGTKSAGIDSVPMPLHPRSGASPPSGASVHARAYVNPIVVVHERGGSRELWDPDALLKDQCPTFETMKSPGLKGVRLITDETENRRYVQIDLVTLAKDPEAVDEYLDGLIAQVRRNEPSIPHEQVMRALYKRAGRK